MRPAQDVKEALLGGNLVPFKSRLVIEKVFFVPENVLVDLDGIVSSMNIVSIL